MAKVKVCDRCGKSVEPSNDALHLDIQMGLLPAIVAVMTHKSRHLLPEGGCIGSPSRAQYLAGQPRDRRGYSYCKEIEGKMRAAYQRMQALPCYS
jgi:hypothetical protein